MIDTAILHGVGDRIDYIQKILRHFGYRLENDEYLLKELDVSSFYLILSVYTRFQIEDNATLSINWTIDVDIASISTFFPFF